MFTRFLRATIVVTVVGMLFAGSWLEMTHAQTTSDIRWTEPIRISSGGFAMLPFIVADPSGALHVVWSENVGDPEDELHLDTIFYAEKRGDIWSSPVDIFVAPDEGQAIVNRLRIDASGYLQVLWVSQPGITYATAPAAKAGSAQAWRATRIPENAWNADFAIGPNHTLHVVYILERQGIYYVQSADGGDHWSAPTIVWPAPDTYSSPSVRIEVDERGVIHVAWGLTAAFNRWNPVGIAYARSTDNGLTWEETLNVPEGDNLPNIGFDHAGGVHLVWDNPAGSMLGRGHAWSTDEGHTWHGPERIFQGYRGQTWWPVMIRDSAETLHLFTAANAPNGPGEAQTFHSEWQGNRWSEPQLISGQLYGGESPSVAVSEGNKLNVIWFSYNSRENQYGIWYTMGQSAAPSIPPQLMVEPEPTATLAIQPVKPSPSPEPTPVPLAIAVAPSGNGPPSSQFVGLPIAIGAVSALVVVGLGVAYKTVRQRR